METRNSVRHLVPKDQFDHRVRDNIRMNTNEILSEVVTRYGNKLLNVCLTYRVSLLLEAPNYCLCIQSNSTGFSLVNNGKQVHLKQARRHFERYLAKDVHNRSVASRN